MEKKEHEQQYIRTIAEYDGWQYIGNHVVYGPLFRKENKKKDWGLFNYLSDWNELLPITKKAYSELQEMVGQAWEFRPWNDIEYSFKKAVLSFDIDAVFLQTTYIIDRINSLKANNR